MVYLHNIENGLIAKDINNAAKDRPNMSLKYTDAGGRVRGYILAYEGEAEGEKVIYISDLATDKESPMAGGRLVQAFAQTYQREYLAKGNFVPIYAEAREQTSYKLISRQLERLGKELGTEFELEELETYAKGEETMHPVIIRPRKIEKTY